MQRFASPAQREHQSRLLTANLEAIQMGQPTELPMLIPEGCDIPVRHLKAMMQIAEAAERTDREFIHRVQEILIAYAKEQQAARERRVENIS